MSFSTEQSLQEVITQVSEQLEQARLHFGHGTDNAWDEACWLVETLFRRHEGAEFSARSRLARTTLAEIESLLQQRIQERRPLAYLLNEAWFASLPFYVDERVLIPRSPLAELIDREFSPLLKSVPQSILDLCCGSGCIGIAAALQYPQARVCLSDLSADALAVADININEHEVGSRVHAVQSDLFTAIKDKFDLILCNPPYVGESEYRSLPGEYHREPELALLTGDGGLAIPLQVLQQAADYLQEDGWLILEVGNAWESLQATLPEVPFLWLEFDNGGHGVCALNKQQLQSARSRVFSHHAQ